MFLILIFPPNIRADQTKPEITNQFGMTFIYIPAGQFQMGSPANEPGVGRDEALHSVTISKGFYMQNTEVTQKQWQSIMGTNPSAFGASCQGQCPVENVSWYDCQKFIQKLNDLEKTNVYSLPTEAQWEYACRADTQTAFYNGNISELFCGLDPNLNKIGWYCGNSGLTDPPHDLKPHAVAFKEPNGWGLFDMSGNVQEWCQDRCGWLNPITGKPEVSTDTYINNIVDPISTKGSNRVFRGGSWNISARYSRSGNRSSFKPGYKCNYIGLRVLRSE